MLSGLTKFLSWEVEMHGMGAGNGLLNYAHLGIVIQRNALFLKGKPTYVP